MLSKAESYLTTARSASPGLLATQVRGLQHRRCELCCIDNIQVDWNEQAALKAEAYMDQSAFSRSGLITQLKFEGFTPAQAAYGAKSVGSGARHSHPLAW